MSANRKADRQPSRLGLALLGKLERYMARAGLIAFMAEPAAAPAAAAPAAAPAAPPAAAPATHLGADPSAAAAPAVDPAKPADPTAPAAADPKDPKAADPKDPKAADPKDPKDGDKPAGAPEKYEPFKLPEGMKPNEPVLGKFAEIAKKHGLTQEAAQELVDVGAEMQAGNAQQIQAAVEAQGEKWAADAKVDKEFGGDKFDESLAVAKKALDQFGTPELKSLLAQSKLGNHPEVLRTFVRIGRAISEDGFVPGRQGAAAGGSIAQRMYPNMNP